jgi:hypothetical protein
LTPKFVALNILLTLALIATFWQVRVLLSEAQAKAKDKRLNPLGLKAIPLSPPPLVPIPKPEIIDAAKYRDIVSKDLFSQDRNPTVTIDPPPTERRKEMPPLPVVYGVLGLPSGATAIMSEGPGLASRSVHAGDVIGEFRIASLDLDNVVFTWEDQKVYRRIKDLMVRSNASATGAAHSAAANPSAPATPAPQLQNDGQSGRSELPCISGDKSPAGTVVGRYKKKSASTPAGLVCSWVRIQ